MPPLNIYPTYVHRFASSSHAPPAPPQALLINPFVFVLFSKPQDKKKTALAVLRTELRVLTRNRLVRVCVLGLLYNIGFRVVERGHLRDPSGSDDGSVSLPWFIEDAAKLISQAII